MTRISAKTAIAVAGVTDPTKIELPIADMQSPDGSGFGSARKITADVIRQLSTTLLITKASHGLTSGSVGKPLSRFTVLDDTDPDALPSWILTEVVSANVIRVAARGSVIVLPTSLIEDEEAYDPETDGQFVFWDATGSIYVKELPLDSAANMPHILKIVAVNADDSEFTAIVEI